MLFFSCKMPEDWDSVRHHTQRKNNNRPAPPARLPLLCIFKRGQVIPCSCGLSESLIGWCSVLPDDMFCYKSWAMIDIRVIFLNGGWDVQLFVKRNVTLGFRLPSCWLVLFYLTECCFFLLRCTQRPMGRPRGKPSRFTFSSGTQLDRRGGLLLVTLGPHPLHSFLLTHFSPYRVHVLGALHRGGRCWLKT